VRGNLSIFLALAVSGVLNFLAIALYSRLLTPAEYGAYAVVLSAVAMILSFAFSWVEISFLRFASGADKSRRGDICSSFITLYAVLLLCVLGLLVIIFWLDVFATVSVFFLLVVMAVIVAEVLFIAVGNYARLIKEDLKLYSMSLIVRSVLALAMGWYFVTLGYSYTGIIAASALSFAVPAIIVAVRSKIWRDFTVPYINHKLIKDICSFGIPLVLVMVVQSAISATDRLLLAGMLGAEITGQYSASQDLVAKLFIFLLAITHKVAYPLVVKKFEQHGIESARDQLKKSLTFILAASIPALFVLGMYPENFVSVILGVEFRAVAINLMPYQVVISLINCMTMFYVVLPFHLMKKTKQLIYPCLLGLLANLVVGYFAIKLWGIYGAVIGSFVAYSLYFILSFVLGRQFYKLPMDTLDFLKILLSSGMMAFILLPFSGQLGLLALVGMVMTGLVSFAVFMLVLNVGGIRRILFKNIFKVKSSGV